MRRFLPSLAAAFAFSLALALGGCFGGGEENPNGTEVENEVKGILRLADGSPARGAKVRLYPVDFSPLLESADSTDSYSAITDPFGVYRIKDVQPGEYNVLGGLNRLVSYRDSVGVSRGKSDLPPDTLRAPGSLTGFVALQPNHLPSTATVEILGTRFFANVDDSGVFQFTGLAGGRYSIRVTTTLPEYTPLFTGFTLEDAAEDTLADTLRPAYTGIPVVTGLRATYDTAHAVVRLAWDPVSYRHLEDYLIYRDPADQLVPSGRVMGSSLDTVFFDTLQYPISVFPGSLAPSQRYRIRVRNKSDQVGLSFGTLVVATPPPSEVATTSSFRLVRFAWSSALQADSVAVAADLQNRSRGLDSIAWALGSPDSMVGGRSLRNALEASDTLRFVWPKPGSVRVYIRVWDEGGVEWRNNFLVPGNTAPTIQAGTLADTVQGGSLFRYRPSATDPDGDSLKFTVENLPTWATFDPATGEVKGTPENGHAGNYEGLALTVSDGRRKAALPPIRFTVKASPWTRRSMPASITSPTVISFDGEIVVLAAGKKEITPDGEFVSNLESGWFIHSYTPKTDAWKETGFIIENQIVKTFGNETEIALRAAHPWNGSILLVVGNRNFIRPFLIDPLTGKVEPRKFASLGRHDYVTAFSGGKLYIIGGFNSDHAITAIEEYDPDTDQWAFRKNVPYMAQQAAAVGVGDQVFLFGGFVGSYVLPQNALRYTPATDTWIPRTQVPNSLQGVGHKACVAGGKVYAYAGKTNTPKPDSYSDLLQRYDPSTDKWTIQTGPILPRDGRPANCAESDGKLYFFGGATTPSYGVFNHHAAVEVYDPALDKP